MDRSGDEWVGLTPDTPLPERVYKRLWRLQKGRCPKCGRFLRPGHVIREHVKPVWGGGENRESNIQLWCKVPCSSEKTSEEAAPRAKGDRMLRMYLGLKKRKGRPMPGTKASGWKRKVDGSWIKR
jgi:hypothetical protein